MAEQQIAPDTDIPLTLKAEEINLLQLALQRFTVPLMQKISDQAQQFAASMPAPAVRPNGEDSHAPH